MVLLTATLAVLIAPPLQAQTSGPSTAAAMTLPAGEVAAGRQAFLALKCHVCHAVPSDPQMPRPLGSSPGPAIDLRLAGRSISYLMTAMVSPSHVVSINTSAAVRRQMEGVLSPMGDFSRVMTVRQLVDLYAFIRSAR